jgi:tetratricopeptide (TPR) repeat protein
MQSKGKGNGKHPLIWRPPTRVQATRRLAKLAAMTKPGRNDPCPCGSGKKYKRCCLQKDEAAERAALAAATPTPTPHSGPKTMLYPDFDDDEDHLTPASNAVVDLVREGKLDEAEAAARDLLLRFPEVHDGYYRLAMVYEARGDRQKAADYYRKVIDFIRQHPDQYEPDFEDVFRKRVDKLDPPAPT